jgi:PAS domain S-box-containing protein
MSEGLKDKDGRTNDAAVGRGHGLDQGESYTESWIGVESVFELLHEHVCAVGNSGDVVYINHALLDRLGFSKDEIVGQPMSRFHLMSGHTGFESVLSSIRAGCNKTVRAELVTIKGIRSAVETTIVCTKPGESKLFYCLIRDVVKREKTEGYEYAHFLQSLIDAVPSPIYYKGTDLKYLGCNKAFVKWRGIGREELKGKRVHDIRPSDEADSHHREDLSLLEKGGNVVYESLYHQPDGRIHHVINSKGVFTKPDGSVGGIVGIILDVTERRKAEAELERQTHVLNLMTGQMKDMVYYKDSDFRYVFASKLHCENILMASQEDCVGHTDEEIAELRKDGGDWGPARIFAKSDRRAREAGQPSRFEEMVMVKGESVWLEIYNSPIYDENGEFVGIVGSSRDITERKRNEQRLRESEERLRLLIEGTDDVITLQDREGKFLYYNGTYTYGLEDGTILGKTPYDVFQLGEASEMMDHLRSVFETGQSLTTEEDVVRDGRRLWFNVKRYPIRDEESAIISVATISRNITDRKQMEEDLIKTQKLESIGTLAGGIAHDFNNILTVILGNMTLAKMSIAEGNKALKRLKDAEKATMRAKDLTQQLLTFAKGGEPFKRVIFINRLIEDSANLALSGSNVKCEYAMADNLFPVEIDEGQMRQVIHNIVTNAKEAMPSGGVVSIHSENVILGPQNDLSLRSGRYVRIAIQDKGPGIPEAYLQKVFDPYFTTKEMGSEKGTGLGLAICYSIVKKHHGHIRAESGAGLGSTFHIYLPGYQRDLAVDDQSGRANIQEKRGRVLLMDDEEMILEITAEILGTLGYQVVFARDGDEAVRLYRESKDSGQPFHAVILDLTIPGGMGGKEAIQKLIEIDPHVKGIVSSGYSNDPVMADFRKYGFSGIISKPFLIEELNEALRTVIVKVDRQPSGSRSQKSKIK